jgi:hypothetical protein
MRRQARRESCRAWIASGAAVTVKTYARRYGIDRYTACEDLAAIGFPLPDSAQRWAHRLPPQPRPRGSATPRALLDDDWIMIGGRPYIVAGYTPCGAPYGIYLDEMDDDYPTEMITPQADPTRYTTRIYSVRNHRHRLGAHIAMTRLPGGQRW